MFLSPGSKISSNTLRNSPKLIYVCLFSNTWSDFQYPLSLSRQFHNMNHDKVKRSTYKDKIWPKSGISTPQQHITNEYKYDLLRDLSYTLSNFETPLSLPQVFSHTALCLVKMFIYKHQKESKLRNHNSYHCIAKEFPSHYKFTFQILAPNLRPHSVFQSFVFFPTWALIS